MRSRLLSKIKTVNINSISSSSPPKSKRGGNGNKSKVPDESSPTKSVTSRVATIAYHKSISPRRAALLKKRINKAQYLKRKKEVISRLLPKVTPSCDNVQKAMRKTSEEYFKKLEAENNIKPHSHTRKVSWKQSDSIRIFDNTQPAADYQEQI